MHQFPHPHQIADRLDVLENELMMLRARQMPMCMMQPMHPMMQQKQHSLPFLGCGSPMPSTLPPLSSTGSSTPGWTPQQLAPMPYGKQDILFESHQELVKAHSDLLERMKKKEAEHDHLLQAHDMLMSAHTKLMAQHVGTGKDAVKTAKKNPKLGVVRLDYNYPPTGGDIDCPASFGYDVIYRVVPGLTFEVCQSGHFDEKVERNFAEAIKYLEMKGANAITGDCGFMMSFQVLARKIATRPVFMSAMCQCPIVACAYDPNDQILILTANGESLKPQKEVLLSSCGFDVAESRFVIKGCQHVPGFDAVAKGEAVPTEIVQPGVVKLTLDVMKQNPRIRVIILECTELPPYADALRAATGLSVFDAITAADFYVGAHKDNPRFGINDWQDDWDGVHEEYHYGDNLSTDAKASLCVKVASGAKAKPKAKSKAMVQKIKKHITKHSSPTLGVIRLDYNYPPAAGDIDCPGSYDYDVLFRCVPGLTFEVAQAGRMPYTVQKEFEIAIKWLESKGVCGITGDCGFMMAFQPIARDIAKVPVFMSAMVQCPMISVAYDKYDKILVLTANGLSLKPQKEILLSQCGFDVDDCRFVIYGCQDVPGFDAVAKGEKVPVEKVTPGVVELTRNVLKKEPSIRAICLECTELPPYSDALRKEFGLPVFDAITCADFFISSRKDNPRFGLNQWQNDWDGTLEEYKFGENLSASQKSHLVTRG